MKSLFDKGDYTKLISRIQLLTTENNAQWGKMSVDQMLAHVNYGLKTAIGKEHPKRVFIGKLIGKMAKKSILKRENFKKNLPTGKEFIVIDQRNFEKEKALLLQQLERIHQTGKTIFTQAPHPFFGKMTPDEWDLLQLKHIDHHLQQFNA